MILSGILKKIRFTGRDFWTVAVLDDGKSECTIVGNLPTGSIGMELKLHGDWVVNRKFGRQFQFHKYEAKQDPLDGVKAFLEQLPYIGPTRAKKILKQFGEKTVHVIENNPKRLVEIPGITEDLIDEIKESYVSFSARREAFIKLSDYGLTPWQIGRVIDTYEGEAVERFETNPYQMVYDIKGFGFQTVDRIARGAGTKPDDPGRIKAGLLYALEMSKERGHMFVSEDELYQGAFDILKLNKSLMKELFAELVRKGYLLNRRGRIFFSNSFGAEYSIAKKLSTLSGYELEAPPEDDGDYEPDHAETPTAAPKPKPAVDDRSPDDKLNELKTWATKKD